MLFGNAYRSFIKETLENIANLGHLDKHNRDDKQIGKVSILVEQSLSKTKEIIEKINKSYVNLLNLNTMIIEDTEIIPWFHSQEKIDKLQPISYNDTKCEQILESITKMNSNSEDIFEKFVKLSDISQIQETFSIPYREFIASIIKLIQTNQIQVEDHYGSNIIFKVLEKT